MKKNKGTRSFLGGPRSWGFVLGAVIMIASLALSLPELPATAKGEGANPPGQCGEGYLFKDEHTPFTYTDPNNIITGVAVKAGASPSGGGCLWYPPLTNGCYQVIGLGSHTVTVTKIGSGPLCKDISHVEFYGAKPTNTPTPTGVPPTQTPTGVPPTLTPTGVPPTQTPTGVPPTQTPTSVPPTERPFIPLTGVTETPTPTATQDPTLSPTVPPTFAPPEATAQVFIPVTGADLSTAQSSAQHATNWASIGGFLAGLVLVLAALLRKH